MKLRMIVALVATMAIGFSAQALACGGKDGKGKVAKSAGTAPKDASTVVLAVKGMSCGGCAAKIASELNKVDGVFTANVNFSSKTATVKFAKGKTSVDKLMATVKKLGYKVAVKKGQATS